MTTCPSGLPSFSECRGDHICQETTLNSMKTTTEFSPKREGQIMEAEPGCVTHDTVDKGNPSDTHALLTALDHHATRIPYISR